MSITLLRCCMNYISSWAGSSPHKKETSIWNCTLFSRHSSEPSRPEVYGSKVSHKQWLYQTAWDQCLNCQPLKKMASWFQQSDIRSCVLNENNNIKHGITVKGFTFLFATLLFSWSSAPASCSLGSLTKGCNSRTGAATTSCRTWTGSAWAGNALQNRAALWLVF